MHRSKAWLEIRRVTYSINNPINNQIMETNNNNENQDQGCCDDAKRHFESCSEAFKSGMDDATEKAKEAAPKIKGAIADAVFDVAYGAAYGAFFASAFANEFIPQSVKDGLAKGAAAGKDAADKMRERAKGSTQEKSDDGGGTIELPAHA